MPDDVPPTLRIHEPVGVWNAPRAQAVRDFVVAVQAKDLGSLRQWLTEDVQWEVVGFQSLEGIDQALAWVEGSRDNIELKFNSILIDGLHAGVDGRVTNVRNITVAFSYIITFSDGDKSARIRSVRSYLVSKPV